MTAKSAGSFVPSAPAASPKRSRRIYCILLLMTAALYYGRFIYSSSFKVEGRRYFCLMDDAMISMRYANHLASGSGLTWNPGEAPVEGFSNPAWVFLMALFHFFPIPPEMMSLCIQVCGALLLIVNLFLVGAVARRLAPGRILPEELSVVLTFAYLPLTVSAQEGLEQCLAVVLISWAMLEAMKGLDEGRMNLRVYLIMGCALWVRMDLLIPLLVIWLVLMRGDAARRRAHFIAGAGAAMISLGMQTAARLLYFGQWLPNTYYLKMTGYPLLLRFSRGGLDFLFFLWSLNPLLVILAFVVVRPWRSMRTALLAALPAGQIVYHIYVGGDIVLSRFLVIAVPAFFILLSLAIGQLVREGAGGSRRWLKMGGMALIPVALLASGGIHDMETARLWLGDPEAFAAQPLVHDNSQHVRRALEVGRLIMPGARVAVTWAGVQGYFIHAPVIDLLGINDPVIARLPARVPEGSRRWTAYYPGHMKWDYAHSIGDLRPDVILEFWGESAEIAPYFERDYKAVNLWEYPMWVRCDSPHIRRGMLQP